MSSVLLSLFPPATPATGKVVKRRRKTPKVATSTQNEECSLLPADVAAVSSPMDCLLEMIVEAIPVDNTEMQASDENVPPAMDDKTLNELINQLAKPKGAAQHKRGQKRKHSQTPAILEQIATPTGEKKRKRKSPLVHADSVCSTCGTRETTLWRRSEEGVECNPCSLYFKKRGVKRPANLQNRVIHKRPRKSCRKDETDVVKNVVEALIDVVSLIY